MIALEDVRARLETALVPATLRSVGLLGELSMVLDQFAGGPSAYVMPSQDKAGPDTSGSVYVRQRVDQQFSIAIIFGGVGSTAAAQLNAIDAVRAAVRTSLIGWLPNPGESADPIRYVGGKIVVADFDRQIILWGEEFAGSYYVRSA